MEPTIKAQRIKRGMRQSNENNSTSQNTNATNVTNKPVTIEMQGMVSHYLQIKNELVTDNIKPNKQWKSQSKL